MLPTTAQLQHFLEVSKFLSISRAAEALHLSQSALSSSIRNLEKTVGAPLLVRHTGKGVRLTERGVALAGHARQVVEELGRMTLATATDAFIGELRIGIYTPLAPRFALQVLSILEPLCDLKRVELVEGDLQELATALTAGRIDWALMYDASLDSRFHFDELDRFSPHVIAAKGFFGDRDPADGISLREVSAYPFILMDTSHSAERYSAYFGSIGQQPEVVRSAVSYELVRAYVAGGHGFSIMHHRLSTSQQRRDDGVEEFALTDDIKQSPLGLVRYSAAAHTTLAQYLVDGLRQAEGLTSEPGF